MNSEAGHPRWVVATERIANSTSCEAVRKSIPMLGRIDATISSAHPSSCMMRTISWSTCAARGNG